MKLPVLPIVAALLLSACAGNSPSEGTRSAADPWETVNRPIDSVNNGLDKALFRPIAKGYETVVPRFMRLGVGNFRQNLRTPLTAINNLLQGKGKAAASDTGRFLLNSTAGVLGLFDPATAAGLPTHNEDFGQTLAVWGVPDGPYVIVPLLGPNTLRDALATPLNIAADPLAWYSDSSVRDKLWALRFVDLRQSLFSAEALIKGSADRYLTIRESFLQRRNFLVHDGDPPVDDDFYDDFLDDEEF